MKKLTKILTIIGLCLMMVACSEETKKEPIALMQERVDEVERNVEELYNQDFNYLVDQYKVLDTTIARIKDIEDEMWLLQAYLQQFETEHDALIANVEYSRQQLADLLEDMKNNVLDSVTVAKYMQDEEKALRMMEAQVEYFKEKFNEQKEVVKQLIEE